MKRSHLWVLNPCLLAMLSTSAWAEEQKEENIVVSASRAHRSVAEMAQTTWVIERAEIEQQVQGGETNHGFVSALARSEPRETRWSLLFLNTF